MIPITIAHASVSTELIVRSVGAEPFEWVYLGENARAARDWEARLGSDAHRIELSRRLEKASDDLRRPFVAWVDLLNRRFGSDRHWWFTQVSERNTLVSPFFLFICYLRVARDLLGQCQPPRLLVVESWGLISALRELARGGGFHTTVIGGWRRRFCDRATRAVRFAATGAYFLLSGLRVHAAAWRSRRIAGRPVFGSDARRPRILLRTFFHETQLSEDATFRDRYFPYLHEWLQRQGIEVWILPAIAERRGSLERKYRWMRTSKSRFLVPEDWLRLSDYLDALVSSIKAWRRPAVVPALDGLDITPLVDEERWRQATGNRYREACLVSRILPNLRDGGFSADHLLYWYENQVTDKGLVIGCREAFPNAKITAVQNTCLFPNLLHSFPTAVEVEMGVIADRIVCNGLLAADVLREESQQKVTTVIGCSMRYQYLWEHGPRSIPVLPPLVVLVAFPFFSSEVEELVDLVAPAILNRRSTRWLLKSHPDMPTKNLERQFSPAMLERVDIVDGALAPFLDLAHVVITGGTGVAVEAAALGIPVILRRSQTSLNYDPLAWFPGLATACATPGELDVELDRIAALEPEQLAQQQRLGEEVRQKVFGPVTEHIFEQFLG